MEFITIFNDTKGYYELWGNGMAILNEGNQVQNCIDFTIEPNDQEGFSTIVKSKIKELPEQINFFCFPLSYTVDGFTLMGIRRKKWEVGIGYTTLKCFSSYANVNNDFMFSTPVMLKGIKECIKNTKDIKLVSEDDGESSIELIVSLPLMNKDQTINQMIGKANRKLWSFLVRVNLYLAAKVLTSSITTLAKRAIEPNFHRLQG